MTARRVVLLCGPPGAGKTTRARELADLHGLDVFDRDEPQWTGDREFRLALAKLAGDSTAAAVVIRSCPTRASRLEIVQLCGATEVELVLEPAEICRQRVIDRGTSVRSGLAGVKAWFDSYDEDEWRLPPAVEPAPVVGPSREW